MSTPGETPGNLQEPAADGSPANGGSRQPPVVEGPGRYVVYEAPDGGWVIARAVGICERCQGCGCGEQGDPVQIPGMVVAFAKQRSTGGNMLAMLKAAARR